MRSDVTGVLLTAHFFPQNLGCLEARSLHLVLVHCTAARWYRPDMRLQCQIYEINQVYVICHLLHSKLADFLLVGPAPYPGYRGCLVTEVSSIARVDFIASAILELGVDRFTSAPRLEANTLIVVLVLMSISAYKSSLSQFFYSFPQPLTSLFTDKSGSQSELLKALHRDGVLFYFHLFGMRICRSHRASTVSKRLTRFYLLECDLDDSPAGKCSPFSSSCGKWPFNSWISSLCLFRTSQPLFRMFNDQCCY